MQRSRLIPTLIAALLLAACSAAQGSTPTVSSDPPTETQLPTESLVSTPTDQPALTDAPTESITAAPTETPTDEYVLAPGQRSEPIAVDAGFHNDAASVVAASGRPQLIEIFTFW